jgi:hypothetical protein
MAEARSGIGIREHFKAIKGMILRLGEIVKEKGKRRKEKGKSERVLSIF